MTKDNIKESKKEDKKVEIKEDEKKSYFNWFIALILIVLISGFIGYKYLLEATDEIKANLKPQAEKQKKSLKAKVDSQPIDFHEEKNLVAKEFNSELVIAPETNVSPDPDIIEAMEEGIEAAEVEVESADVTSPISQTDLVRETIVDQRLIARYDPQEINSIKNQQKMIMLYLAASDVKSNISDPQNFYYQLDFLEEVSSSVPQIRGKVDLLKHASKGGIPTIESLKEDFKKLASAHENNQEKTVWEGIGASISDIVKITKVEGEPESNDAYTIYKRVEAALNENDITRATEEASQLGEAANKWVMKAKNLKRVIETVDYIIGFSRNNMGAR